VFYFIVFALSSMSPILIMMNIDYLFYPLKYIDEQFIMWSMPFMVPECRMGPESERENTRFHVCYHFFTAENSGTEIIFNPDDHLNRQMSDWDDAAKQDFSKHVTYYPFVQMEQYVEVKKLESTYIQSYSSNKKHYDIYLFLCRRYSQ